MLIQAIYAVYDLKAESFSQPFFAVNDAVASRLFVDGVRDRETPVGRNAADYNLMRVGAWNADKGLVAGTDAPIPVMSGLEALKLREVN